MDHRHFPSLRPHPSGTVRPLLAVSLALGLAACGSTGGQPFAGKDADFKGRVNVVDTPLVLAGKRVAMAGQDFMPGQKVSLSYGGVELGASATVGADGKFRAEFVLPAHAEPGRYSLVVSAANPSASLLVPLKISPDVPLSGQDRFEAQFKALVPGLYQVAYSARSDRLFVTSAVGRPPVTRSQLVKVNPQTLVIEQAVTPAAVPILPSRSDAPAAVAGTPAQPPVYAVYGVGVDDVNGTVWVTNTRQDTLAVYRQSDLALVKQFDPGTLPHARDVVVDELRGKVYASPFGPKHVVVFDAKSTHLLKNIPIETSRRGRDAKDFSPLSLALDENSARLFVVSLNTNEVAIIDTKTDTVVKVYPVDGAASASGIAYDGVNDRILVAAQGSDNLIVLDAKTGKVLHDVKVGAGALNVTFDPVRRLAYVSNRGAGTLTVVDTDGKIVANLGGGTFPNHVAADGKGGVFAVNKSRGETDDQGDRIGRVVPR